VRNPPPFIRSYAALRYEAPVNHLISRFKFHRQLHLAKPLAWLMIEGVGELREPPDVLIPVPLHPQRLRERGFNQSLELARVVARHYGLRLDWHLCRRVRATPPQSELDRKQRWKNLRGAFEVSGNLAGRRVVLLDDVVTTGATVRALGKVLLQAGAAGIEVWTLARTAT